MRTQLPTMRPAELVVNPRALVAGILLTCLLGLALSGFVGVVLPLSTVRAEATDGMRHLKHAQALLAPFLKQPGIPAPNMLHAVKGDLATAEVEFARTRRDLGAGVLSLAGGASPTHGTVAAAAALAAAADEACLAGLDLLGTTDGLLPALQGGLMGGEAPPAPSAGSAAKSAPAPAITAAMLQRVTLAFEDAVRHLTAAMTYAGHADLSALPSSLVSGQQVAQLRSALAQWPHIQPVLAQLDSWLHVAPALLGVKAPERFLVELLDRGELRTTGGYLGSYGVMTIQGGRIQPFTLADIQSLDRPYEQRAHWPGPPAAYAWWPMPGFGLRDSNLSPDFPTASRLAIQLLAKEGGPQVQGVVAFNVVAIERVLAVVGPVAMPSYHLSVTAQNLEAVIRVNTETTYLNDPVRHEQFTAELGHAFMNKLHSLTGPELVGTAKSLLASMRTKDVQVYLADTAAESLLGEQGLTSAMIRGPGDALTIVDSNVTINKVNLITSVAYRDAVSLDARGTATHHLTITYAFDSAKHPDLQLVLFGRDFYMTYLRVYTPANARLVSYDGFNGVFGGGSYLQIGTSDEPGHQMWGGYVYVSDAIAYVLHFDWSVPAAATRDRAGHLRYTLQFQHQAGSNQRLDLTIATPGGKAPALAYKGPLDQDRAFTIGS